MTESVQQRVYDKAKKNHLIQKYLEGGHSFVQLSQESGVPAGTLSDWVKAYRKAHKKTEKKAERPAPAPSQHNQETGSSEKKHASEEITRLRKALATAIEEREILKQALRIFSASSA